MGKFEEIGAVIGCLTDKKNLAYGNSFGKTGDFLKLLYPDGIKPEQYKDALLIVRVFDKLMRVAHQKDAFEESPWSDLCGYAILGVSEHEKNKEPT